MAKKITPVQSPSFERLSAVAEFSTIYKSSGRVKIEPERPPAKPEFSSDIRLLRGSASSTSAINCKDLKLVLDHSRQHIISTADQYNKAIASDLRGHIEALRLFINPSLSVQFPATPKHYKLLYDTYGPHQYVKGIKVKATPLIAIPGFEKIRVQAENAALQLQGLIEPTFECYYSKNILVLPKLFGMIEQSAEGLKKQALQAYQATPPVELGQYIRHMSGLHDLHVIKQAIGRIDSIISKLV